MPILTRLSSLWRNLVHKPDVERDLDDELSAYVGELAAEKSKNGMGATEARRTALVEMGGMQQVKERVRDQHRGAWIESVLADLRITMRSLRRTPGFTVIAVTTLALGIGANTALFSVADEVFLKSLPVRNPEELVLFEWTSGPQWIGGTIAGMSVDPVTGALGSTAFSKLTYERFRDQTTTLSSVFAFTSMTPMTLSDSQPASGQLVSGSYFIGLGVRPAAGRLLVPDDDRETAPPAVVISYRFWQRRFGLQPDAIGKTLTLVTRSGSSAVTIVGVTPAAFTGTRQLGTSPDLSFPLALARPLGMEGKSRFDFPWYWPLRIMGRLRPGATYAAVRAELQGALQATALEGWSAMPRHRPNPDIPRLDVTPGGKGLVDARRSLTTAVQIMAVIVVLVLFIVCTNLANLMLARTATRQREMAVRAAIGARRGRLVRHLLTESALLSLVGGGLGVGVAFWAKDVFIAWIHRTNSWFTLEPKLDLRVLGFTVAMSLITGLVVGIVPAFRLTRIDLTHSIKGGSPTTGGPRSFVSRTLMVAQVGISVVLLIGAGLFLRTVRNLRAADVGFEKKNLLIFGGSLRRGSFDPKQQSPQLAWYDDMLAQLGGIPGVRSATFSQYPLLSGDFAMPFLYVPGRARNAGEDRTVYMQEVHPTFFETLGMPVVLGRGLSAQDGRSRVVVNEALARRFFPDGTPLGRTIGITKTPATTTMPDSELAEVVGVVRDAKVTSVRQNVPVTVFRAVTQPGDVTFELRTTVAPMALVAQIRSIAQRSGRFAFDDFRTQEDAARQTFAEEQHFARLTGMFGALATALACLGLYGLMSYQVTRRTHEIGVRMALGAHRGRVMGMVLSETLAMTALGVALGLVAALVLTRLIASLLFGLPWNDALTLGAAAVVMLAVAALAGVLPGWRATQVDPLSALRHD